MNIREQMEERERLICSPYACLSVNSKGRMKPIEECDMRTVFQRDRDRIIHCKSFRRLKHKTQVFLDPQGDHYRTRLTHTLEVSQIARTISRALRLNEDLTEAIALGHDLGHTPFGHAGERMLNQLCSEGFKHYEQSLRVVDILERDGEGLNLTMEVRDGILKHQMDTVPETLEGRVVKLSDKIAYINHDIDDAIRGNILKETDIPSYIRKALGESTKLRLNTLIGDIIANSMDKDDICMSEDIQDGLMELRKFMFRSVYTNPIAKGEEGKASEILKRLFNFYMDNVEMLPNSYIEMMYRGNSQERVVCDYISGMTDQFAMSKYTELFMPKSWMKV